MRSCLECKLLHFWTGHSAWSEVTPGDDPEFHCDATPPHWTLSLMKDGLPEVRAALLFADTCPDFTPLDNPPPPSTPLPGGTPLARGILTMKENHESD